MSPAAPFRRPPTDEPAREATVVGPRLDRRAQARLDHARGLARLLDNAFRIPGTNIRFGIEPLISLFPWAGDVAAGALSLLVIWNANRLGVSPVIQLRMALNVFFDVVLGSIPVVGDIADFFFKPNQRNLELLERYLHTGERRARASDWLVVTGTVLLLAASILIPLALAALVIGWAARTVGGLL